MDKRIIIQREIAREFPSIIYTYGRRIGVNRVQTKLYFNDFLPFTAPVEVLTVYDEICDTLRVESFSLPDIINAYQSKKVLTQTAMEIAAKRDLHFLSALNSSCFSSPQIKDISELNSSIKEIAIATKVLANLCAGYYQFSKWVPKPINEPVTYPND